MSDYNRGQLDLINKLLNRRAFFEVSAEHQRKMLKNMRAYIKAKERKE